MRCAFQFVCPEGTSVKTSVEKGILVHLDLILTASGNGGVRIWKDPEVFT